MSRVPVGGRLGRYQIERMLGAGAMGEVYLAEDPQIGRRVAIKTVRVEEGKPSELEERKRRLLREARAAGRLLHPNVVALFDAGEDQGVLYLAFECVEGMDLAQRLEQSPPLTLREVLHYVRQAADGLDYAHRQGIVHRDIKPSNLLLGPGGQVKVSDFGIAKLSEQTSELTMTGSVVGSPYYLSPEQIRGDDLDGRSDIFSLGVLLYEVLSRQRPFQGETLTTLVYQILHRDPPSVVVTRPELGSRLEDTLRRMLHKDRDQRFATAGEVSRALALVESELPAAILDRPAAPGDQPPLDGTRRMSTSERALETGTQAAAPRGTAPPIPPAVPTLGTGATDLLPRATAAPPPPPPPPPAVSGPAGASSGAGAARSSKAGLVVVATIVGVVLLLLVVGGLAARRWAAQKEEPKGISASNGTVVATLPPVTPAEPKTAPADEPKAQPLAVDPGQRFSQTPQEPAPSKPEATEPAKPTPAPVTPVQEPKTEPKPVRPTPAPPKPAPVPASEPVDESPEPEPPVAERPGIVPAVDRVVTAGMSLSFDVEPEDAIVKVDNRVIGQAWTWNAKKKEGRAYDLPEAGEHIVRIVSEGKTYTIRLVATRGAPSPTLIAVDLEGGAAKSRRRRFGSKD